MLNVHTLSDVGICQPRIHGLYLLTTKCSAAVLKLYLRYTRSAVSCKSFYIFSDKEKTTTFRKSKTNECVVHSGGLRIRVGRIGEVRFVRLCLVRAC